MKKLIEGRYEKEILSTKKIATRSNKSKPNYALFNTDLGLILQYVGKFDPWCYRRASIAHGILSCTGNLKFVFLHHLHSFNYEIFIIFTKDRLSPFSIPITKSTHKEIVGSLRPHWIELQELIVLKQIKEINKLERGNIDLAFLKFGAPINLYPTLENVTKFILDGFLYLLNSFVVKLFKLMIYLTKVH